MPNAFTPNGDHLNDEARPVLYCDFVLQEFSIYNRAGKRVFTTNSLQKGWDGNFNGTPCDPNVYFYMIRGKDNKGQDVISKGDITLIR
jgi:gliding motility-associated-like protein